MYADANAMLEPIKLGGKAYAKGIGHQFWGRDSASWDLGDGGWSRLKGVVGFTFRPDEKLSDTDRQNVKVRFIIEGDEKELFRSEPMLYESNPLPIDISIQGVKHLTLKCVNEASWTMAVDSVNWADVKVVR